jgi:pyridoxine 5-phosphate synthase
MAVTEEMIRVAVDIRPGQVSLVPERPEEVTTEGGLDLVGLSDEVGAASRRLAAAGILVSAFVDPEPRQISRLAELKPAGVAGFEINTDRYTRTGGDPSELKRIVECAELGERAGLEVYAGHGLTTANVGPIAAISQIEELNIGHSIISRAVLVGMEAAGKEMLTAMQAPHRG